MNVKDIKLLNFDMLYSITVSKFNNEVTRSREFGRNLSQLYNHIQITLSLENVNLYEYIFLKTFTSECSSFTNMHIDDGLLSFNNYPSLINGINGIVGITNTLKNFSIKNQCIEPGVENYPMGVINGDVVVSFTGDKLSTIIGLDSSKFFIGVIPDIIYKKNDLKGHEMIMMKEEYPDFIQKISDGIVKEFIQKFYKYTIDKISYMDYASDGFTHNYFTNKSSTSATLSTIRNPEFLIDFVNDPLENSQKEFMLYKEKEYSNDFTIKNTKLEFQLSVPMYVYIELLSVLPADRFISQDNLNIPFKESFQGKEKYHPIIDKKFKDYTTRIETRVGTFVDAVKNEIEKDSSHKGLLVYYMSTMSSVLYNVDILISLEDINRYLSNIYQKKVISTSDKKTSDVISLIVKYSNIIFKYIKSK